MRVKSNFSNIVLTLAQLLPLRASLSKMGPFRSGTVSAMKNAVLGFETEGKGPFVRGNGTEPVYPNRP